MYQNTCVDFKLGYVDAKSDAIAFCVKTYPSGSFIKNRTNMHEMQNRMKIASSAKPPLPPILLANRACAIAVDLGGPKFEVKHNSRCLQKSKLVDWGAKHVDWGGRPPLAPALLADKGGPT